MNLSNLDKHILTLGYMKRRYSYYIILSIALWIGLWASITSFFLFDSPLILGLTVIVFTFFRMQIAFVGHDLTHNQVFKSKKYNAFFGYITWWVLTGLSQGYWKDKHNRHHENTNQSGLDPDLEIPFAFLREHVLAEKWYFKKLVLPYQHILFFLSLPFAYIEFIRSSLRYIFTHRKAFSFLELSLMLGNFTFVIWMFLYSQWFFVGWILLAIHTLLAGIYMSLSFAPNHLGMETIPAGTDYERVYQIITSRNLKSNTLKTFIFGGLDYQIEHHLYPTMPRINYPKIGPLVEAYCKQNNIPYSKTTLSKSFQEIYTALRKFSKI